MISLIIRTKNEERWIVPCLQKIQAQTLQDFEIILVDNKSTDKTVDKAFQVNPDIILVEIEKYLPGLALNKGIRVSKGDFIACLSAHCLPVREDWLANLYANFSDSQVAGVYGRQIPMKFTPAIDKRDLLVTFGLDKRIHKRDSFFHNANSMIRRSIWEIYPFNETVTNIEDRVWGKTVIEASYTLVYEPEAPVYHHHGIHQSNDKMRYNGVVRILDKLELVPEAAHDEPLNPENFEIAAIIPLRKSNDSNNIDENEEVVSKTIDAAKKSKYIHKIIIATDSSEIASKAKDWGVLVPFIRPESLSLKGVRADDVLEYSLRKLEEQGYYPDLIVPLEVTYPFRPEGLLDSLIERLIEEGLDTVIAGIPEYRPCWINKDNTFERVDDCTHLRDERKPILIGLPSLGCVTFPEYIRRASRLGKNVGIYEISDPRASLEIRTINDYKLLKGWLEQINPHGTS